MIQFKQLPLNGLNTFEDELLYLFSGIIRLLVGIKEDSKINGKSITNCLICCEPEPIDTIPMHRIVKIFTKYNKSFNGLFEIRITLNGGRYKLKIEENMQNLSKDVAKMMRAQ